MTAPTRVSNKQILDALQELPLAIAKAMQSTAPTQPTVETTAPVVQNGEAKIKVDEAYLNHMTGVWQKFADTKGEDVIGYARKNQRGETKLAYCLASKWTGLKDRGLLGAVKHLSPTA